ncbi:hypothetical protein MNBD_ALPHA06-215 [hydrothermal vent metagenome]|uniref:Uncharacterized protein n=1 Tax=hydrothermal vent metagenome TaxID=652676 RepID=A0A3B0SD57_9ZZZZ
MARFYRISIALAGCLLLAFPVQAAPLSQRDQDIIQAAAIYTSLAFSISNRQARRKKLPLSEDEYKRLDQVLPPRFQACLEGGFAVAFPKPADAQTLRLLMQSVVDSQVPEPANASLVLPGFVATNQWCTSRIPLWTSVILN